MSPRQAARAPARVDFRACPVGSQRGIDVARLFGEIEKLTRAYAAKHASDLDVDDLVQEVGVAIASKNLSEKSAFDPTRSSFGHYVTMVARSKAGHMRDKRYHQGEVATEGDALEALHDAGVAEGVVGAKRDVADRRTVAELVELIREAEQTAMAQARHLRSRDALAAARADGIAEASRRYSALLEGAFEPHVELPPLRSSRPRGPPADPYAHVRRTLKVALASWSTAVAAEDARLRAKLSASLASLRKAPKRRSAPRRARGDKRNALERLLQTKRGQQLTHAELALRIGASERYVRRLSGEIRNTSEIPHPKRAKILAAIAANPIASNRAIARRAGCDHKTVGYLRGTSSSVAVAADARSARRS